MALRHRWKPHERQRTIDVYLKHQRALREYGRDVEALAKELELPLDKVIDAVDAVGTADKGNAREKPSASKALVKEFTRRSR